jgi:spore germination protein GerM
MRVLVALFASLLTVTAGCGVDPEERPQPLTIPAPSVQAEEPREGRATKVALYFVRGGDLAPVLRRTAGADAASVLDLLMAGPTRGEVLSGLRTALAPQSPTVDEGPPGGVTAVSVTREFTGITGGNQLLAVAQVVWTLTELPGTTEIRFYVDGAPVEVPTDQGLTDQGVDRDDYTSVAPATPAPPTADPTVRSGPPPSN